MQLIIEGAGFDPEKTKSYGPLENIGLVGLGVGFSEGLVVGCTDDIDYTALKIDDQLILKEFMGTNGQIRVDAFSDGNLQPIGI